MSLAPAAINPFGKVPALLDGEQPLFESGAILIHLANKWVAAAAWIRVAWLVVARQRLRHGHHGGTI